MVGAMLRIVCAVVLLAGACDREAANESASAPPATATAAAQAPAEPGPPPEVARPYEEGVDAQAAIDAAVAGADGKRVLLMFGANWCPWCRRLEHTFRNAPAVSAKLAEAYELVHVDVGPRDSDRNREVARRYGDPLSRGLPCLVVLDEEGEVAHVQETGSLEVGDRHDPAKVLAFLERWER
ncbi:MAG: hypothetical protein CMN31_13945 [Sandaracinus sp.]|nr:hypothetical protein [Myxococcales bacterium]MAT24466.1 hypothetical protein [Sandaracinus sp.]MBJ72416.1 hypothetical protein [Sandaracinus sp.]